MHWHNLLTLSAISSPQRMLSVCWYYRPEETVHPVQRTFYENEVFKTGNFMVHVLEDYLEKCLVMFYTKVKLSLFAFAERATS